jgi:2-hydroxychromene-2-carboxylate isomerase
MSGSVRFLFDYISPYAYLASTQVRALAGKYGRDVEPVPILFAALLEANHTRGPGEIPAKRAYLFKDIVRIARALSVPLEPPATHPFNPLLALRVTAAVEDRALRWSLVDAIYSATWARSERVDTPDVIARIAREAGLDGETLIAGASSLDAKARLRANTEDALSAGVFGVPTMLVDGEIFWGTDSLPHLDRYLRGEDPVDPRTVARWSTVTPSAQRRSEARGD